MPLPVAPIVIAGATAAIGYFFQENSAKNARIHRRLDIERENTRRIQDRELQTAQAIHHELTATVDVLYYYLEHGAMYAAVRKAQKDNSTADQDAEVWRNYQQARLTWMTHKNRFAAQARRYFGPQAHQLLEEIRDAFERSGSVLNATYYGRKGSLVTKAGKVSTSRFYSLIAPLEQRLIELNECMISDLQSENVGLLRSPD